MHSLAGFHLADQLVTRPPYSDPHHSASVVSMVGGGPRLAKPGRDLAGPQGRALPRRGPRVRAGGDRRAAYAAGVRHGQINRSEGPARYPGPVPADPGRESRARADWPPRPAAECQCAPLAVRRYAERISGPIRDRIDINQGFLPMRKAYLKAALQRSEPSAVVAERVREARERQLRRLAGTGWRTNGEVAGTLPAQAAAAAGRDCRRWTTRTTAAGSARAAWTRCCG